MGLSIDGVIDNIKIIDVNVCEGKLYAEDELKHIDIKFRYEYTFLDKLAGEIELPISNVPEVKKVIAHDILDKIDERGMYV